VQRKPFLVRSTNNHGEYLLMFFRANSIAIASILK
jgi:hypothetical protein